MERIPARTRVEDWVWTRDFAVPLVERQLNVHSLEGFGLTGHQAAAIAAGAVLHYVRTTQKNEALHIDSLKFEEHSTALELDQVTVRNLELVEPLFPGPGRPGDALSHAGCVPDADGQAAAASHDSAAVWWTPERSTARYEAVAEAHGDLVKREEMRRAFAGHSGSGAAAGAALARFSGTARCAGARRKSRRGCRA